MAQAPFRYDFRVSIAKRVDNAKSLWLTDEMLDYPQTKPCGRCKTVKPAADFRASRAHKTGLQGYCKNCQDEYTKKRFDAMTTDQILAHREKDKARSKKYHHQVRKLNRGGFPSRDMTPAERVAVNMIYGARRRSKKYEEDCDLEYEWVAKKIDSGFCERSGAPFDLTNDKTKRMRPLAPSLDRIDSSRGYCKSNVQVVCTIYNVGKSHHTDAEFIDFCKQVAMFNADTTDNKD